MPDLPDYKIMYAILCAALSDSIALIRHGCAVPPSPQGEGFPWGKLAPLGD